MLSSHYLELTSNKGRVEADKVIAKEFELDCKGTIGVYLVLRGYTLTSTQCSYSAMATLTGAALFDSRGTIARLAENDVHMR